MGLDAAVELGIATARAVAAGEPFEAFLVDAVRHLIQADAGVGLSRWDKDDGVAQLLAVAGAPPPTSDDLAVQAAIAHEHPSFQPDALPFTHRVSERVPRMAEFWSSDVFAAMHRHANGLYPASVPLMLTRGSLVHLGVHRQVRDFTDDEMAALEACARPIRAAIAFRAALDEAIAGLPARPDVDARFTAKEVDVLVLVAAGWTDHHIARRLGISESTVRQRLTTARERVGAVNRTHLVVRWLEVSGRVVGGHPARDRDAWTDRTTRAR
jgi:DNA-binding CsgD family transcriptional regulator